MHKLLIVAAAGSCAVHAGNPVLGTGMATYFALAILILGDHLGDRWIKRHRPRERERLDR